MKARLYKAAYTAILIIVFAGCYFLFNHFKKQSNLNDYFYEKVERCHYIVYHPCRRMISASLREYYAEEWVKIKGQMLEDGYTRAEVEKMDSKAFNATQNKFQDLGEKFWKDMDEKYGG